MLSEEGEEVLEHSLDVASSCGWDVELLEESWVTHAGLSFLEAKVSVTVSVLSIAGKDDLDWVWTFLLVFTLVGSISVVVVVTTLVLVKILSSLDELSWSELFGSISLVDVLEGSLDICVVDVLSVCLPLSWDVVLHPLWVLEALLGLVETEFMIFVSVNGIACENEIDGLLLWVWLVFTSGVGGISVGTSSGGGAILMDLGGDLLVELKARGSSDEKK